MLSRERVFLGLVGVAAWLSAVVIGLSLSRWAKGVLQGHSALPGVVEFLRFTAEEAQMNLLFGAIHSCTAQLPLLIVWCLGSLASTEPRRHIGEGLRATAIGTVAFPISAAWVLFTAPPLCRFYDYRFGPPFYGEGGQGLVVVASLLPAATGVALLCRWIHGAGAEGEFRLARIVLWALTSFLYSWQVYGFALEAYPALIH